MKITKPYVLRRYVNTKRHSDGIEEDRYIHALSDLVHLQYRPTGEDQAIRYPLRVYRFIEFHRSDGVEGAGDPVKCNAKLA